MANTLDQLLGATSSLASLRKAPAADAKTRHLNAEISKVLHVMKVRERYNWPWGAGAEYLYRALIHALGLEKYENELLQAAKPKPGRKKDLELFLMILSLKKEGKTVRQIRKELERGGRSYSQEAIESYLKTRRRTNPF